MGIFDDIRETAENLAGEHGDTIAEGIDKAADLLDDHTGGEHRDTIDTGVEKAKDLVEKLGEAGRA